MMWTEIINGIPVDTRPTFNYRCYDSTGQLLYVGTSVNPVARVQDHRASSWWGSRIATTRFIVWPNRPKALEQERKAIYTERPSCNIRGRWYRHDPREGWTAEDYLGIREAIVAHCAANTGIGDGSTRRVLAQIDAELLDRFGVTAIKKAGAA